MRCQRFEIQDAAPKAQEEDSIVIIDGAFGATRRTAEDFDNPGEGTER